LGLGTGLLAIGLAAGIILFAQLKPDLFFPPAPQQAAAQAASDAKEAPPAAGSAKPVPGEGKAAPAETKSAASVSSPSRGLVMPEAICDGIVCVLAVPAGIYLFFQGARANKSAAV
jgi:hypothetical protein